MRRQPALLLAEIAWRWCFAAAAGLATGLMLFAYLNSIRVSWREELLVGSGNPLLALAGVVHALRGSAGRLAAGIVIAGTALAVAWILCAALGRLATLNALLPGAGPGAYPSLLGLSFLRAGLFLAGLLAGTGALILGAPSAGAAPHWVVILALMACIWLAWALLNWLLSLAAIFVVGERQDTFGAIAAAEDLVRERVGEIVLTSLPFVLLHYAALAAALAAGVLIFDLMVRISPGAGWALLAVAAGYFAYADFLYITRLAAYVALGRGAEAQTAEAERRPQDARPPLADELGFSPEVS